MEVVAEALLATETATMTVAVEAITVVVAAAAAMITDTATEDPATRTGPIAVSERITARVVSIAMPLAMIAMAARTVVAEAGDTITSVLHRPQLAAPGVMVTLLLLVRTRTGEADPTRTVVMINAILVRPSLTLPEPKRF